MTQTAVMGPPLSPREPRRSGRRSAPSGSTSTSKSPDSDSWPRPKESARTTSSSSNGNGKGKRPKQEEIDDAVDEPKAPSNSSSSSTHSTSNGRKRKGKDKEKQPSKDEAPTEEPQPPPEESNVVGDGAEEEEQGVTRCACGSTGEDDQDAGEFMVQCETCKVWQHGLCMGFDSEDQLHEDDYYCEKCRPDLHPDMPIVKKAPKRARQSSANSHHTTGAVSSRLSRSHSPSVLLKHQPSKRRNTMNSRDAEFDEALKQVLEATAAEAGEDVKPPASVQNAESEDEEEAKSIGPVNRKRRRRSDSDAGAKKRTRSMSSASDHPTTSVQPREETPVQATVKTPSTSVPPSKPGPKPKRGGRKAVVQDPPVDTPDGTPLVTKGRGGNGRGKGTTISRKAPHSSANASIETNGRGKNVNGTTTSSVAGDSRSYRAAQAYGTSQQSFFTSWGLPDYLAHLSEILPTDTPQPLEVHSGTSRDDSLERNLERGVKVKWPSKRTSVGDMNKRVRALVEWVGREQATASDRQRRKTTLNSALDPAPMDVDGDPGSSQSPPQATSDLEVTMNDMEKLMEDLIGFQERFGPGVKTRDRDRRTA